MQRDEEFAAFIVEPLEVLGLDSFGASSVNIRVRLKTLPMKQWAVRREFQHWMIEAYRRTRKDGAAVWRARFGKVIVLVALAGLGGCAGMPDSDATGSDQRLVRASRAAPEEARTADIRITGVDEPVADNVLAHLSLATEVCDAPRWRMDALADRAEDEAREALRALGYYQPERISVSFGKVAECWKAEVAIAPGDAALLSTVDIRLEGPGSDDPEFRTLLGALPLAAGDAVHHGIYESVKRSIEDHALEHGFLDGAFLTKRLSVDVPARSVAVTLVYAPGQRYRFGKLHVDAPQGDGTLIERLADYPEGEPFGRDALLEMNRRLSESGYFERVEVRPRLDQPVEGTVPVDLSVAPRTRHAFTARIGVSTDAGPRARLGYENRRLNKHGHRFASSAAASFIGQSLDAEYRVPLAHAATDWLGLRAGAVQEDTDTSHTRQASLGLAWTLRRRDAWWETRFVSVAHDEFAVGRQRGTTLLVTPGVRYATTRSDNPLRPTDGYRLQFELAGSHRVLGSDVSFLRAYASAGWVHETPWGGRVLARSELGAVAVGTLEHLPPSQRFFTGGDDTVRGYAFESLGPLNADGEVVGGRFLATGSLEYEHPFDESWSGAVFLDAGNAFAFESDREELALGAGIGARWQSPVGTVRLDVAHPFNGTRSLRMHLRLGPDL